jgi:hypothetical protein
MKTATIPEEKPSRAHSDFVTGTDTGTDTKVPNLIVRDQTTISVNQDAGIHQSTIPSLRTDSHCALKITRNTREE